MNLITLLAVSLLRIVGLQCDYETNPIGLDNPTPCLSWQIESDGHNVRQQAYRILVATTPEQLQNDNGDQWDSGWQSSDQMTAIPYEGAALTSFSAYYWKVLVRTNQQEQVVGSDVATFEMGTMNESDWGEAWIGYATGYPGRVLYFKGTYAPGQEVRQARAYVSGLGFYEMEINHRKVGDRVLDPALSTYSKRAYYATLDCTDYLKNEANTIVVAVAPGWYGSPKLRMMMRVVLADGSIQWFTTGSMRTLTAGSTLYSTIYDGETFDGREENPELYMPYQPPLLMNQRWAFAYNSEEPTGQMRSERVDPIRVVDSLNPLSVKRLDNGDYVVDAGRNMAGWARIKVKGEAGTKVTLRFAETLRDDGQVNQDNLRNAKATDTYFLSGQGTEVWEPRFTYHGFRYVQISGLPTPPAEGDIQLRVVRSSVPVTGHFSCSDSLLNDIHRMVFNTEAANLHSVPTDCPQRDERMGWLNDLTVRIEQAIYNFDMSRFYPKFMRDITDTQGDDGTITCVAPFRYGARPADPVCASYLLLACKCYEFYGNRQLVAEQYDHMKAWTDYLNSRTADGIVDYSYYGDWCPPREFLVNPLAGVSRDTPGQLISTGYLYYCARMIAQVAELLGKTDDAAYYTGLATKVDEAFNRTYWDEEKGGYASNNQACNCFPLYMGLAHGERAERALKNLVADVKAHDYHLTTGNLCTKYLLEVLTEQGYPEVAYRIATQTTYPSWGYMLSKGATTLWERWEYLTGDEMNSHNHPMMGSVGSWFYKYVLGIRSDFDHPGFSRVILQPYIFRDLTHAEGDLQTVRGTVRSAWRKEGRTLTYNVTIPAGTTAEIHIPTTAPAQVLEGGRRVQEGSDFHIVESNKQGLTVEVGSGDYCFTAKCK